MTFIVAAFLIVLATLVAWYVVPTLRPATAKSRLRAAAITAGALLLVIVTALSSVHTIGAGHTGLVYQIGKSGKIVGRTESGIVFTAPWQGVREINTQIQRAEFPDIVGFSRESQDVIFDIVLNYQIDANQIDNLYTNVGPNWFETLVPSRVLNDAKEQTVKYTSVEIAPNRDEIRKSLVKLLNEQLGPDCDESRLRGCKAVLISDVNIRNIDFSKKFKDAIERKQEATQDAQTAQARVAQRKAEAEQNVALAEGDARSTLIRAESQAKANHLLASALTPVFVDYQRVLALQDLAKSPNIQLVPSNAFFNFTPGKAATTK